MGRLQWAKESMSSEVRQCRHHPKLISLGQIVYCLCFWAMTIVSWPNCRFSYSQEDTTKISRVKWWDGRQIRRLWSWALCGLGSKQNQVDSDKGELTEE